MVLWKVRYTCAHSGHPRSVKVLAKNPLQARLRVQIRNRGYYEANLAELFTVTRVWPK